MTAPSRRHGSALLLVAVAAKRRRERKVRTDVPSLVWHAPFFSGGGYCSEATAFIVALDDMKLHVAIEMHGDSHNNDYMNGLSPVTLGRLYTMAGRRQGRPPGRRHLSLGTRRVARAQHRRGRRRPARGPAHEMGGPYYVVGRTMFETDRLPDGWVDRLNNVDEVWVPTDFHKAIFEDAGVANVFVVGEPVDTDRFTPEGPRYDIAR